MEIITPYSATMTTLSGPDSGEASSAGSVRRSVYLMNDFSFRGCLKLCLVGLTMETQRH